MLRLLGICIFLMIFMTACGGSFKRQQGETVYPEKPSREKTDVEALNLEKDLEIVPEKYSISTLASIDTGQNLISAGDLRIYTDLDSAGNTNRQFRIQLFSSNTYGPAARELLIAREVFDRPVYLDYEVPYYKVRVGNFQRQSDAEDYLVAAQEAGYNTAWVVRVTLDINEMEEIYKNENIPPLFEKSVDSSDSVIETPEFREIDVGDSED